MKQKYTVTRGEDGNRLIMREYAELDKDIMSLLCEESYDVKKVESALKGGKDSLITALRTPNMYPARVYAERIADAVIELQQTPDKSEVEVFFDDMEFLSNTRKRAVEVEEVEEEETEIDELLEEEFEDEYEDKPSIDKLNSSLKVDEEDLTDFDEEI